MYNIRTKFYNNKMIFIRKNNMNIVYFYFLCLKYKFLYFLFRYNYCNKYGNPGNIIKCSDGKTYTVVHNDYQSTIILYKDNIFKILLCCTSLFRCIKSLMISYDIMILHNTNTNNNINISNISLESIYVYHKEDGYIGILEFRNILILFHEVMKYLKILHDKSYLNSIIHIGKMNAHLIYLCEEPALRIQRKFRKIISDPTYKMCRSRLYHEYNNLINDVYIT